MTKKLRLTLTDAQWEELKARATSQRTNPATMIKRLLFPKVRPVEKRGTNDTEQWMPAYYPENGITPYEKNIYAPTTTTNASHSIGYVELPMTPEMYPSCSFCGSSRKVWLNGNEIPCPKCGLRVEVVE